jgi:hypothetical protein
VLLVWLVLYSVIVSFMAGQLLLGQSLLVEGVSRSHSDTPQSVGLLWTSDQPDSETSSWQHKQLHETDIHACGGIRTLDPIKRKATDPRLRLRGHWDWLLWLLEEPNTSMEYWWNDTDRGKHRTWTKDYPVLHCETQTALWDGVESNPKFLD